MPPFVVHLSCADVGGCSFPQTVLMELGLSHLLGVDPWGQYKSDAAILHKQKGSLSHIRSPKSEEENGRRHWRVFRSATSCKSERKKSSPVGRWREPLPLILFAKEGSYFCLCLSFWLRRDATTFLAGWGRVPPPIIPMERQDFNISRLNIWTVFV